MLATAERSAGSRTAERRESRAAWGHTATRPLGPRRVCAVVVVVVVVLDDVVVAVFHIGGSCR